MDEMNRDERYDGHTNNAKKDICTTFRRQEATLERSCFRALHELQKLHKAVRSRNRKPNRPPNWLRFPSFESHKPQRLRPKSTTYPQRATWKALGQHPTNNIQHPIPTRRRTL